MFESKCFTLDMEPKMIKMIIFKSTPVIANDYEGIDDDGIDARIYMTYRVSLKKRSLTRLAPLEAPRLFLGLEIIPKCYEILFCWSGVPIYPFSYHL